MKTEGPATTTRNTVQTGAGAAVEPLARYIVVWPRRARVSFYELIISQFHRRKNKRAEPTQEAVDESGSEASLEARHQDARGTKRHERRGALPKQRKTQAQVSDREWNNQGHEHGRKD